MKSVHLDTRLYAAACYVRRGSRVADIGTDHGYLTAYLIQNGISPSAIASDINRKPLESAVKNAAEYGVSDRTEFRLGGGLDTVSPDECDDIVIAGMGGELIASIIDGAGWLKNARYRLILQPMSKAELLRKYLCDNGFRIIDETAVFAKSKHYTVMAAEYDGSAAEYDDLFIYIGRLTDRRDELSNAYKRLVINKLEKRMNGLLKSGGDRTEAERIGRLIDEIRATFGQTDSREK